MLVTIRKYLLFRLKRLVGCYVFIPKMLVLLVISLNISEYTEIKDLVNKNRGSSRVLFQALMALQAKFSPHFVEGL